MLLWDSLGLGKKLPLHLFNSSFAQICGHLVLFFFTKKKNKTKKINADFAGFALWANFQFTNQLLS